MPVPSTITDLSTTAALNSPAGSDAIANTLDDYLRATQAILKGQFSTGSAISVTGTTITIPVTGSYFSVTGLTTYSVTGFNTNFDGRIATLKFADSNLTLVNSASLILPNAANIAAVAGDVGVFVNEGSGSIWRCISYTTKGGSMPAGTQMMFAQASAPVGWTQVVTDAANNRMLRVVNTAGAGVGGANSPILMDVVPNHTHTFTSGNESADHAHYFGATTGGMSGNRYHTHVYSKDVFTLRNDLFSGSDKQAIRTYGGGSSTTDSTDLEHGHIVQGWTGGINTNHTHSGTTDGNASASNWTPRYLDLILCQKA